MFSELRWNVIIRLVDVQTHTQPSTTFVIMNTVESLPGRDAKQQSREFEDPKRLYQKPSIEE